MTVVEFLVGGERGDEAEYYTPPFGSLFRESLSDDRDFCSS
jgi:hypothetical protein